MPGTRSTDPVAVVVGGNGGIGSALVEALVQRGDFSQIYSCQRSPRPSPVGVIQLSLDLEDEGSIAAAAQQASDAGPLGLVIVATGALQFEGYSPEKTNKALDPLAMMRAYQINAIGPALVAKHMLPLMRKDACSVFAALSARVGSIGDNRLGGWHSYRASKAALNMLIKTMAIEHARKNPLGLCVGLHPGTVQTALSQPFRPDAAASGILTPQRSAHHLLQVMDQLLPEQTGGLFGWDGIEIRP